jgi:hypothetical protein
MQHGGERAYAFQSVCQAVGKQIETRSAPGTSAMNDRAFSALLHGPDHRFVLANPAYQQLVGRCVIGRTVREASSKSKAKGFLLCLTRCFPRENPL